MDIRKKMMWFCLTLTVVCSGFVRAAFPPGLLYKNDFETRQSQMPVPSSEWMTMSYTAKASLYSNFSQTDANILSPYGDKAKIQDGWTKSFNSAGLPGYVQTNAEGNALAFLSHSTEANQHGIARHSLYNNFTNGTVVLEADLRPPAVWADSSRAMSIYLGDEVFNSPYPGDRNLFTSNTVGYMGFKAVDGNTKGTRLNITGGTDARNGAAKALAGTVIDASHWYRFSGRFNLDTGTFTATVYDMGTSQPTLNTPTPVTAFATFTDIPFRRDIAHGLSGVSSIGIGAYGTKGTWSANPENGAAFDNIRIAWRAPDSETDEDCYLNDFTVCRRRILTPRAAEYVYPLTNESTTNSFTGYIVNPATNTVLLVPASNGSTSGLQPTGIDAWRRLNPAGYNTFSVTELNSNAVLRIQAVADRSSFGLVSHPIGTTVSGGHLRLRTDIRTPNKWYWDSYHNVKVALGDDLYYGGGKNEYGSHQHLSLGIDSASSKVTDFNPYSSGKEIEIDAETQLAPSTWYRIVADLNIDAWTYDYSLYVMGTTPPAFSQPAGALLYQRTGIAMKTNQMAHTISSFGLMSYGCGLFDDANINRCAYFDNIEISAYASDPADARTLYSNDFSTRTIIQDRTEATLVGAIDRIAGSRDMWIRRNTGTTSVKVVKPLGGKNRIEFSDANGGTFAYATQLFPKTVRDGVFYLQTDIRPPSAWFWKDSRSVTVYIGDLTFWQGNINSGNAFSAHTPVSFGFGNPNTNDASSIALMLSHGDGEHYDGTNVKEFSDAAIDTSHWYRFRMKADMYKETLSLTVFDMGGQPSFDSEPLAEVAQFTDRPFRRHIAHNRNASLPDVDGFGSLALCAFGVRGEGLRVPESERAYFTNLTYGHHPSGQIITIR